MTHQATLGADPRGNLTRIDNALAQMPQRLESVKAQLDNLYQQQAAAKEEVGRPFPMRMSCGRNRPGLQELDTLLNIDSKAPARRKPSLPKYAPLRPGGASPSHAAESGRQKSKTHEEVR